MFDNKTEDEIDFCESYKSQILNNGTEEKNSSLGTVLKILTILLLLTVIVALSTYGYNYFMNQNSSKTADSILPSSIQISDEDLKVIDESSDETNEVQKPLQEEEPSKNTNETQIVIQKEEVVYEEVVPEKIETEEIVPKEIIPPVSEEVHSTEKPTNISTTNESDIDKIANDMKVAIAQAEEKDKNKSMVEEKSTTPEIKENISEEESLKVPVPNSPEAKYLEDLADLSKEIDKERKNK